MNEAAILEQKSVAAEGLDDLLALVGLPSQRRSVGKIDAQVALNFVDDLLLRAISTDTRAEFVAARDAVFGQYARTITLLARLIKAVVPAASIQSLLSDSFCELEAEFREHGLERFGAAGRDQAVFTVWSLRRTSGLIAKIASSGKVSDELSERDRKLAASFGFFATWTQFNLDCLLASIRHDKTIQLDVLPEIIDGLRAAVNAYGYAREGLELRLPQHDPEIAPYQWDDEDQALLESSMRDFEHQVTELVWNDDEAKHLNLIRQNEKLLAGLPVKEPPHAFGTHLKEGADIIKDWLQNPKPRE